jgi:cellulose synthase/poly-beta-1,6-N-acetylglucosamine synthase-like glycosyltransferase
VTSFAVAALAGLLLIWVGYPCAVFFLAWLRRTPATLAQTHTPSVSVIVATAGSSADIHARVADLLQTSFDRTKLDIIIGLDAVNKKARADELTDLGPRVRVIEGDPSGGKAATLNAAVRASTAEILVFTDTAQSFRPDVIPLLVRSLDDPSVGAVSGMLETTASGKKRTIADQYWRYERRLRNAEAALHSAIGVTGAIYATRRDLWEPLPADLILDDLYVPMRLVLRGKRIAYNDRAIAFDARSFAPRQEYQRKVRTLTGVIQLCAWLPKVLNPVRNPVWIQFICHKLLRLLTPYLAAIVAIGVAWRIGEAIVHADTRVPLIVTALLLAVLLLLPSLRRKFAAQLAWGIALQTSVVVATVNGLRGRWDVWRR